jgi:hypothetical protein
MGKHKPGSSSALQVTEQDTPQRRHYLVTEASLPCYKAICNRLHILHVFGEIN